MQTLKQVLSREDERQNLKTMVLCYALVIALIGAILILLSVRSPFPGGPDLSPGEQGSPAAQSDRVSK